MRKKFGYRFGLQITIIEVHPQMTHCDDVFQSAFCLSLRFTIMVFLVLLSGIRMEVRITD